MGNGLALLVVNGGLPCSSQGGQPRMIERLEKRLRRDKRLDAQPRRLGDAPRERWVPAGAALRIGQSWCQTVYSSAPTLQRGHARQQPGTPARKPARRTFLTVALWFWHSVAFLIPALLATDYTVNRFYTLGAAMWDSGWYAHIAASGLRNPPAIGGWFLSDHMSLLFAVTALV